jgi:hypothetical protein
MRPDGAVAVWENMHGSHCGIDKAYVRFEVPRYLGINRLEPALVYCLGSNAKGALIPLRLVGSFLEFIPARLGRNAALDDAVSCLCAIYRSSSSIPYNLHRTIRQSYVKALSSLRVCLSDASLQMKSETLCASILLQLCEVSVVLASFLNLWLKRNFPRKARCQCR